MSTSDSLKNSQRWQCPACDKSFGRKEHLQRHEDTLHRAWMRYNCEQCNKTFGRKDIFARHMNKIHNQHPSLQSHTIGSNSQDSPTRGKRSQAALDRSKSACKRCSKLKMKCDGQQPCQRCSNDVRLRVACTYSSGRGRYENIINSPYTPSTERYSSTPLQQLNSRQPSLSPDGSRVQVGNQSGGIMTLASAALTEEVYKADHPNIDVHSHDLDRLLADGEIHPSLFDDILDDSNGTFSWLFAGVPASATVPPLMNAENLEVSMGNIPMDVSVPQTMQGRGTSKEQFQDPTDHSSSDGERSGEGSVWPNARGPESKTQELTIVPLSIEGADQATLLFENTYQVLQVQNGIQERMISLVEMSDLTTSEKVQAKLMLERTSTLAVNAFVQLYFEHYDQLCPIIHQPTFDPNTCHPFLLCAISAIGANYSAIPKADLFAKNLMVLVNRTWFANFAKQSRNMVNIQLMQSLLLNINFFRSSGNRRMLELAESARSPLTTMIRRSKLLDTSTVEGTPLQEDWQKWIDFETGNRLAWMFFVCDVELSAVWNLPPSFGLYELKAQLPCDERNWRSNGQITWTRLRPSRMPIYLNGSIEELRGKHAIMQGSYTKLQKSIIACALCSLGLALGNVRASPMSFITFEASQHYIDLCSTFVIKEKVAGNEFAEMLVRFALLRHKVDILDLQLLTGRAARRENTSLALDRIKQSFSQSSSSNSNSNNSGEIDRIGLMAHIIHCGRIIHLYRTRPIDSTYADCILFYAISSLYAFSCLWKDISSTIHQEDNIGRSEFCLDGESFIDVGHNLDILTCRLTMKGVGCITSPESPTKIMAICAKELLDRPSGTSWPIGKLLGYIAKEVANSPPV